jgi:hypothetical protein
VIDYLITRRQTLKYRFFLYATFFSMAFYFLHGFLALGSSKAYIAEAGDWMQKNIPTDASLYVNDYQLMYYSQHFGDQLFTLFPLYQQKNMLTTNDWKQFDYLAFRFTQKQSANREALIQKISIQPVKTYYNKRGDKVVIYKMPHEERTT